MHLGAADGPADPELLETQQIPRAALIVFPSASSWAVTGWGAGELLYLHASKGGMKEEEKADCGSDGLKTGDRQAL